VIGFFDWCKISSIVVFPTKYVNLAVLRINSGESIGVAFLYFLSQYLYRALLSDNIKAIEENAAISM
jgi:hypothetical protein